MPPHSLRASRARVPASFSPWNSLWLLAAIAILAETALGGDRAVRQPSTTRVAKYRSGSIELQTDLRAKKANSLLRRLESTLSTISRYWGRPCDRRIVFFVVDDLSNWPAESLPNPQASAVLAHIGGSVEIPVRQAGEALEAHVYATSARGIAEHELVHAYCMLAFGTCGPDWYKEGMAEMAYYSSSGHRSVQCTGDVVLQLRKDRARPIREIVHAGTFTQPLAEKFETPGAGHRARSTPEVSWRAEDDDLVRTARESYHRSWALCYFLANHPSYRDRFRRLGIGYLHGAGPDFDATFGPVADRLAFEFGLFLRDIAPGYRVDLCRWDWESSFSELPPGESRATRVLARRGYQPAGLLVAEGSRYDYVADGQWSTCRRRLPSTADGSYFGEGSLEGVILTDYDLGRPFELGSSGSFVAERAGKLFLRCRDDWHRIADNEGAIEVRLQRGGEPTE